MVRRRSSLLCLLLATALPNLVIAKIKHFPLTSKKTRLSKISGDKNNWERALNLLEIEEDASLDPLYRGYGTHYVDLDVGCPRQRQTLIVDTGSSTTGFPCSDCDGCGDGYHLNPNFEESESTCFSQIECAECQLGYRCINTVQEPGYGSCSVGVSYVEGSSWSGYEAEDKVALGGTPDEEQFRSRFSCQTELTGLFKTQLADGILGMGKGENSLWKQMAKNGLIDREQFSLCYEKEECATSPAGAMVLGGSDKRLHETPMVYAVDKPSLWSDWFHVKIRKIYLKDVDGGVANMTTIRLPQEDRTPIVDSGTTYTYLSSAFANSIRAAWSEVTDIPFSSLDNVSPNEVSKLPTFVFQLEGTSCQTNRKASSLARSLDPKHSKDIIIEMPPSRYMEWRRGNYYSASIEFTENDSGVLGANFIAGHDVHFDNENGRIGFAKSHCDLEKIDTDTVPESPIDRCDLFGNYMENLENLAADISLSRPSLRGGS